MQTCILSCHALQARKIHHGSCRAATDQMQLSTAYATAARLPRHSEAGGRAGNIAAMLPGSLRGRRACSPVRWLLSALIWSQQMGQGASSATLLGRVQMMRDSQATRLSSSVNLW